jgi:hypothetical protein
MAVLIEAQPSCSYTGHPYTSQLKKGNEETGKVEEDEFCDQMLYL